MKNKSETNGEPEGPAPAHIAGAVFLTVVFGLLLFAFEVYLANSYYRRLHGLADVIVSNWPFSDYLDAAPVSLSMLGARTVIVLIAIATGYSILLHPLIGRVVSRTIHFLTELIDSVYRLEGDSALSDWSSGASLVTGSAWPVTMIAIPFLLIAIVIGNIYRALWRW